MRKTHSVHKFERRILGGRRVEFYIDEETGKRKRRLVKTGGYEVWKCMIPGCKSYYPTEMAIGLKSICWGCDMELTLNVKNMALKHPTHEHCRKIKMRVA